MHFCGLVFLHTYLGRISLFNILSSDCPILHFFFNMRDQLSNPYKNMRQMYFSAYFILYALTQETARHRAMAWEFDIPEINLFLYLICHNFYVLISRGKRYTKHLYVAIIPTIRTMRHCHTEYIMDL